MRFRLAAVAATALFVAAHAHAAGPANFVDGVLVAANGMTLYTFDKDATNKSNCSGGCLQAWPALLAGTDAQVAAPFSVFSRDDGARQIAWNGKPLYFYVADRKAGDATGDKQGGVWHVVREGARRSAATQPGAPSYRY